MVDRILASVRDGRRTVAAFYGHPGVFAFATHESIRRARAEGYRARMLPGVSAEVRRTPRSDEVRAPGPATA